MKIESNAVALKHIVVNINLPTVNKWLYGVLQASHCSRLSPLALARVVAHLIAPAHQCDKLPT